VDAVGFADLDVAQSGGGQRALVLAGQGASDAAGPLLHVGAGRVVHVVVGNDVGDGEASAGSEDAGDFAQNAGLVGGEVDDAVGDDDVDALVVEGDLLDVALDELDVVQPRRLGACDASR
jgi:hypothetical protein